MIKSLIVAHPDDEIIWFSPGSFDLIIIVFLARHDKLHMKHWRERAIAEHPLKEKIILLHIDEPGFWKDGSRVEQYQAAQEQLINSLMQLKQIYPIMTIFTHNSKGEYGHDDHILVHEVVTLIFEETKIYCPVELGNLNRRDIIISVDNDLNFYKQVKEIYIKNKAWTWRYDYLPPNKLHYFLTTRIKK